MVDMGPAVLNGGLSTLIAFILLLSSDSYFFLTFFKIFFLTVLFGVWHGLVLLPVKDCIKWQSGQGALPDRNVLCAILERVWRLVEAEHA